MTSIDLRYYLLKKKWISTEILEQAQTRCEDQRITLCEYMIKQKLLDSEQFALQAAADFGLALVDLKKTPCELQNDATHIPTSLLMKHQAIPLRVNADTLTLGMINPCHQEALDAFRVHTDKKIIVALVPGDQFYEYRHQKFHAQKDLPPIDEPLDIKNQHIDLNKHDDEPLVHYINSTLLHAIHARASDIHFEPFKKNMRLRYRIDGLLHEITRIPNHLISRIMTRLKIMSHLDISEKRLPQDGHFSVNIDNKPIDFRISTCPVLFGEKIVIRILNDSLTELDVSQLGLDKNQLEIVLDAIKHPQGLILMTGPTGSGKTMTLYSLLKKLNREEKNIVTIENPVEIQVDNINQVNINEKLGFHFSTALRAFLRQDPDVIMVGEIRDHETASIAIRAAQTGHLVLSTLHTNSALETVTRLTNMGVEPFNIANALILSMAQRLVRTLCQHCKQKGCGRCRSGYVGRTGIFECVPIDKTLFQAIVNNKSLDALCAKNPYCSLHDSAKALVLAGKTTQQEINRVLHHD